MENQNKREVTVRFKTTEEENYILGYNPDVTDLSGYISLIDGLMGVDNFDIMSEMLHFVPGIVQTAKHMCIPIDEAESLLDVRRLFVDKYNSCITGIRNGNLEFNYPDDVK